MDNTIKAILNNTYHTIETLSEILDIPPNKLQNNQKMNEQELERLCMLKDMLKSNNYKYC